MVLFAFQQCRFATGVIGLNYDRYYRNPANLPQTSGLYVVFACVYHPTDNTITEGRIIYIGKTKNLQERHFKDWVYCHGRLNDFDFDKKCDSLESVLYSYAEVDTRLLDKVGNALIAMQQPTLNTDLKDSYNHAADEFRLYGNTLGFNTTWFGFSRNYEISSFYTVSEVDQL